MSDEEPPIGSGEVPPIDPDLNDDFSTWLQHIERQELDHLRVEDTLRHLVQREIGQRYIIKWIAVAAGVVVILGMALLLWHLVHSVFWGPFVFASPAFSVAMILAPVASITAITVALFVGAFRKFEEKDLETIGNGLNGAASAIRGG